MQSSNNSFLSLVRLGIGHRAEAISDTAHWNELQAIAERHGLAAVLVDGIEQLPDNLRPPKEDLLQMVGQVLQSYEYRHELYCRAIAELAAFYREHDLKMMILKGYACSLDWPKPEHRPCGDIDIWLFGKQKEADAVLEKEMPAQVVQGNQKFKVDMSHHHHTVFYWRSFMVENHYDFVNVYERQSSKQIEEIFKELGREDCYFTDVYGERVYLPSSDLHALFLIRHLVSHFASVGINLRQVLDWAFFVEKHKDDVDWNWLLGVLDIYHMRDFFNLINAICVEDLGFRAEFFPMTQFLPELKERVLADILDPAYGAAEPSGFISRIAYKFHRWQGNAWKQRLCYSDSRWSTFWSGFWSHLLKPLSI